MRRPVAGSRRVGESRHGPVAQLLIALSPLSALLVLYAVAGWISAPLQTAAGGSANRLGRPLHVDGPAGLDRTLFGHVPSQWLQAHLLGAAPHWWDALASLVYVTHVLVIPVLTGVVWFRLRDRFTAWITSVIVLTTLGVVGYVLYPAAPPWLASDRGQLGAVRRTSTLGWDYLHLGPLRSLTDLAQSQSNPVAAMPSLHAGAALLVALFLWPVVSAAWRLVLLGYVLAMAATIVYTGEHYVVDVLAGWGVAVVAATVAAAVGRRRAVPTSPLGVVEKVPSTR